MQNGLLQLLESKLELDSLSEDIDLVKQLEDHIKYMLDHQFERLNWLLYRIDVDEDLLKNLLAGSSESPHKIISAEVLHRCKQILETRKEYGSHQSSDWSFDV